MSNLLDTPVLTLAIDNLSKLHSIDEKGLSTIWNLFTKCKDNLENGRRLENISWRLWYRSCHPPPLDLPDLQPPVTSSSFTRLLDSPLQPVKKPSLPSVSPASSVSPALPPVPTLLTGLEKKATFFISSASTSPSSLPLSSSSLQLESPSLQRQTQDEETPLAHVADSLDMKRERDYSYYQRQDQEEEDDYEDSIYSEDFSDDETESCYGESWSCSGSPLFSKVVPPRTPLIQSTFQTPLIDKKSSLLSAALHRPCQESPHRPLEKLPDATMSQSLRDTLLWDRCMPFNTTLSPTAKRSRHVTQSWTGHEDLEDYW